MEGKDIQFGDGRVRYCDGCVEMELGRGDAEEMLTNWYFTEIKLRFSQ